VTASLKSDSFIHSFNTSSVFWINYKIGGMKIRRMENARNNSKSEQFLNGTSAYIRPFSALPWCGKADKRV